MVRAAVLAIGLVLTASSAEAQGGWAPFDVWVRAPRDPAARVLGSRFDSRFHSAVPSDLVDPNAIVTREVRVSGAFARVFETSFERVVNAIAWDAADRWRLPQREWAVYRSFEATRVEALSPQAEVRVSSYDRWYVSAIAYGHLVEARFMGRPERRHELNRGQPLSLPLPSSIPALLREGYEQAWIDVVGYAHRPRRPVSLPSDAAVWSSLLQRADPEPILMRLSWAPQDIEPDDDLGYAVRVSVEHVRAPAHRGRSGVPRLEVTAIDGGVHYVPFFSSRAPPGVLEWDLSSEPASRRVVGERLLVHRTSGFAIDILDHDVCHERDLDRGRCRIARVLVTRPVLSRALARPGGRLELIDRTNDASITIRVERAELCAGCPNLTAEPR